MSTLGLAMIVKDEDKELERLFESTKGVFDDMVVAWNGTNPATKEICERYGVRVIPYEWIDDFAHARNFSFEQLNTEYIMWLDADDTLVNANQLRSTVANGFNSRPGINVLELPYHYDHDEAGNCVMKLWLARVIKRGTFTWKGAIHEALLPVVDFQKCRAENVYVRHNVDPERVKRSAERNLRISKREYEREHRDNCIDPRTTLYYAKALNATGNYGGAIEVFEEYLEQSEWDDERYQVLGILSDLHTRSRQYVKAMDYARRAITLRPQYGQAYFELAEVYYRMEKWEDCLHLCNIGLNSKIPDAVIPVDPMEYQFKPLILLEMCNFHMGNPQKSLEYINEALRLKPENEYMLQRKEAVKGFMMRMQLEDSALKLAHWLSNENRQKLKLFTMALPEVVKDHPTFVRLINQFKREEGDNNRLVIFCGPTFEAWSPDTAKTKGLGGSEEAVVYLAKELVKLGWVVDVYCNCDKPGLYDGVTYRNFWEHDKAKSCDIFIAWRNSEYVEQAPDDSRVFVWLHDRQKPDYWTPERLERIEKIIVLSHYHRNDLPDFPEDKFLYSRNGLVTSQFAIASKIAKDPVKCFYGSSPDRGLDILLELWPEIRKEVPDAHLHVFYGFSQTYDKLHQDHANMMAFKEHVLEMLKQDGVHYHGRVSHAELHDHMMTSGLWLYPTHFTEISCITAMKAQAAGAIPVTMTLAALDETVQYGYKISFGIQDTRARKAFVNMVVDLLKNPDKQDKIRQEMMAWALEHYSWEKVAQQWHSIFKPTKPSLILPGDPEFNK